MGDAVKASVSLSLTHSLTHTHTYTHTHTGAAPEGGGETAPGLRAVE